jgi:hypothetical protein
MYVLDLLERLAIFAGSRCSKSLCVSQENLNAGSRKVSCCDDSETSASSAFLVDGQGQLTKQSVTQQSERARMVSAMSVLDTTPDDQSGLLVTLHTLSSKFTSCSMPTTRASCRRVSLFSLLVAGIARLPKQKTAPRGSSAQR